MMKDPLFRNSLLVSFFVHLLFVLIMVTGPIGKSNENFIKIERFEIKALSEKRKALRAEKSFVEEAGGTPYADSAFYEYQDIVKKHIAKNKNYPFYARMKKLEGSVKIGFIIKADGELKHVEISDSSGVPVLDEAAVRTIRKSERFPEFPQALKEEEMEMMVILAYKIDGASIDNRY